MAVARFKSMSTHASVLRADGTVEDLGLVAYWHSNPILNFLGQRKVRRGR